MDAVGGRLRPGLRLADGVRPGRRPGPGQARRHAGGRRRRRRAAVRRVQPADDRDPAHRGPAAADRVQPGPVPPGGQREPGRARRPGRRSRPPARPRRRRGQAASGPRRVPSRCRDPVRALRSVRRTWRTGDRAHRRQHLSRLRARGGRPRADAPGHRRLPRGHVRAGARRAGPVVRRRRRAGAGRGQRSGSTWPGCRRSGCPTTTPGSTCPGWPASGSSAPTGPASPAWPGTRARSRPSACPATSWPACSAAMRPGCTCGTSRAGWAPPRRSRPRSARPAPR